MCQITKLMGGTNQEQTYCETHEQLLGHGSTQCPGPTGEPSLSGRLSELTVRLHKGVFDISVGSSLIENLVPGTFSVLKRDRLEGYMVTLSFVLTSTRYAEIISRLETSSGIAGENVTVGARFEPMSQNLVPPTTAQSI